MTRELTPTALEPLFFPPKETRFRSYAEVCQPFTPSHALHCLLTIGSERYNNALNTVNRCLHRLELGTRFFSVEQLEREAALLEQETKDVDFYEWCEKAFWGLPRSEYEEHDCELNSLLTELQAEDERYEHLSHEDLLGALIEVEP